MSQGLTFASALNQGTGLFGELNRLAIARDEQARRVEQDAAQQALRQQIFEAQQQAAAEQQARLQAEQQAGASLLAQLGVAIPQAGFVGPVTPQYPTPNVDLAALSPTTQRALAEPAMRAQQQSAADQLAQQRNESKRTRLIDEVTRLDSEIDRRSEKDPIRRQLEVRRAAAEAALLNLDFDAPMGTAMTALGAGGSSGPSPTSIRQANTGYAAVMGIAAKAQEVINNPDLPEDAQVVPVLDRLLAQADAEMQNAYLNRWGHEHGSFIQPASAESGGLLMTTRNGRMRVLDKALSAFDRAFKTGTSEKSAAGPVSQNPMGSPEGQSAALDRAAGAVTPISAQSAMQQAKAALQQAGRWPVTPEELAAVAKQLMTQGAQ